MIEARLEPAAFRQVHKLCLAYATEIASPGVRLFRRIVGGGATKSESWRDVALIGADHIGDVLCRSMGLALLKKLLPHCRFHFIASSPAAELLETHPSLTSVIVSDKPIENRSVSDRVRLLRARRFDAVLCYDTGDYWKDQLATALARIPNCIGYTHKGFRGFVTHPLPFRFPSSYAESFVRSVASLRPVRDLPDLRPRVFLTPEDRKVTEELVEKLKLRGMRLLAVGITGNQPHGNQLKERMLETISLLIKEHMIIPLFFGTAADNDEIEARCNAHGIQGVNLCGKLRVRQSVALLKHMDAAFTVDSGLRHMANAANIPVVYFRNLYTFKGETGNYLSTEIDIAPDVECLSRKILADAPPLFSVCQGVEAILRGLSASSTV